MTVDAIDDLFEVRAKQAADRLDLIGDLRPIAEHVDLWVAAIDLLREELGEGHAMWLDRIEDDMTGGVVHADHVRLPEVRRRIVEYWRHVHDLAQRVAGYASSSCAANRHVAYEHAMGLILAMTDVQVLSCTVVFEGEIDTVVPS